jgi:integration host factor subunit alpha
MNALNKALIAEFLTNKLNLSKPDAKLLVDEFFYEIKYLLESGENIKLSGFGNFMLRDKPERPGRNPKTGEVVPVLARRVVTFKPGLKLKSQIEELTIKN